MAEFCRSCPGELEHKVEEGLWCCVECPNVYTDEYVRRYFDRAEDAAVARPDPEVRGTFRWVDPGEELRPTAELNGLRNLIEANRNAVIAEIQEPQERQRHEIELGEALIAEEE